MATTTIPGRWVQVQADIAAGRCPPVFITSDGRIGLHYPAGMGKMMPAALAAMVPAERIAEARQRQAREAEERAARCKQLRDADAARDALKATWADRRVWGLCGMYVEEMTGPRYTLAEIRRWADWHAHGQFRPNQNLTAVCYGGERSVDRQVVAEELYNFFDIGGTRDRYAKFDFAALVQQLESMTAESRQRTAAGK